MRLITRQSLAATAAERWARQYSLTGVPRVASLASGRDPDAIHAQLVALGPSPNPDDVTLAIGNDSWTVVPHCHECNRGDLPAVVTIDIDMGEEECHLCGGCLITALHLIELNS